MPATVRLPAERNKVAEERIIPLTPLAVALLDELPRLGACALTTRGDVPFGNTASRKAMLDAAIARERAEARLGRPLAKRRSA